VRAARFLWFAAALVAGATVCVAQGPPTSPMNVKAGTFREGFLWILDVNGDGEYTAPPDRAYGFGGIAGDIPLAGVWCGAVGPNCFSSVYASAGIFRQANGLFILDTLNNGTAGTVYYNFFTNIPNGHQAGDLPVAGDWSGSGTTKVGIYRPSTGTWYLDYNGNGVYDAGEQTYQLGGITTPPADVPVVGDWNGSGFAKAGIFRDGYYWILDYNGHGTDYQTFPFGGIAGDTPVAGAWTTGVGYAEVGLVRPFAPGTAPGLWILDANNDHAIDQGDLLFGFGGVTTPAPPDVPVVGKWNPDQNGIIPSTPTTLSVNGVQWRKLRSAGGGDDINLRFHV
jgi:hypothetical protein